MLEREGGGRGCGHEQYNPNTLVLLYCMLVTCFGAFPTQAAAVAAAGAAGALLFLGLSLAQENFELHACGHE